MRTGGIEPPAKPWKGFMLPLHHARFMKVVMERIKYDVTKTSNQSDNVNLS